MNICMPISGPRKRPWNFPCALSQAQPAFTLKTYSPHTLITAIPLLSGIHVPTSESLIKQKGALTEPFWTSPTWSPAILQSHLAWPLRHDDLKSRQACGDLPPRRFFSGLSVCPQSCLAQHTLADALAISRVLLPWTAGPWALLYVLESFSGGNQPNSYKNW